MLPLVDITPDTHLSATLAVCATFLVALITATWRVANMLRDVRDQLKGMRADIRESWTRREQERWAFELERRNRQLPIDVPPVPERPDEPDSKG
jgi:hypothetical protein